jgi:alkylated DNA repair dioxygenase AlkB
MVSVARSKKQKSVAAFAFNNNNAFKRRPTSSSSGSSQKGGNSRFLPCPLCNRSFPIHRLEKHASQCNGITIPTEQKDTKDGDFVAEKTPFLIPTAEPIPGLFLYEEFITSDEETQLIYELDRQSHQDWKHEHHSGSHREQRFGVDHDLWSAQTRAPKHEIPHCVQLIILPKLKRIQAMKGSVPNETNAIDYRRKLGHSLTAHMDDRKKHKEPLVNLSLVGDCYMTFCNNHVVKKILLKRRTLQIMTGKARYMYTHGIDNEDLLSDRRVSINMRQTVGSF